MTKTEPKLTEAWPHTWETRTQVSESCTDTERSLSVVHKREVWVRNYIPLWQCFKRKKKKEDLRRYAKIYGDMQRFTEICKGLQGFTRVYRNMLSSFPTTFQVIHVRITAKTTPLKQHVSGYSWTSSESTELFSFKRHLSVSKCIRSIPLLMVHLLATWFNSHPSFFSSNIKLN